MFLHHFVCSVHFPTIQKHIGIETIPHFYWKHDKGVEPANSIQPAFSRDFVKRFPMPKKAVFERSRLKKASVGVHILLVVEQSSPEKRQ